MQVLRRLRKLCELCAQFVLLHEICFNLQMNLWPTRLFIGSFIAAVDKVDTNGIGIRWHSAVFLETRNEDLRQINWNRLFTLSRSG